MEHIPADAAPREADLPMHLTAEVSPGQWTRQPGTYPAARLAVAAALGVSVRVRVRVRVCDRHGRVWRDVTPPVSGGRPATRFPPSPPYPGGGYDPDPDFAVLTAVVLSVSPEHLAPAVTAASGRLTAGLGLRPGMLPGEIAAAARASRSRP